MPPIGTFLTAYLRSSDALLYGKLSELATTISGWLRYTTTVFPHYTSHAADHSERIIHALSNLLFDDEGNPIIKLSAIEAYVLCAAAYLHDSGMVVTESEQEATIHSDDWRAWTGQEQFAGHLEAIAAFRSGSQPDDKMLRDFIADRQLRYLLAEYFRRKHHERAALVINTYAAELSGFDLGSVELRNTIAAICVGHGLRPDELVDPERYPLRRDVRFEPVNVRLLAILLRLGDLLDMDSDRACPLVLNAVDRMPSDSTAHWTQYKCIVHRVITPRSIEIHALCDTQDEYRILVDWCQWIVQEVQRAPALLAGSTRHAEWRPPIATMGSPLATIQVKPSTRATFIPSNWRFELDADAVYERFIRDAYASPLAFVRELLQNSLDASRCSLYLRTGVAPRPKYPTEFPERLREEYFVRIRVHTERIFDEFSRTEKTVQVLTVSDRGIGMDSEVIQRFLLQVGRSFYRTNEFRRRFGFIPTSRFGIGFLSVFAISDYVVVETRREGSHEGAVVITLTGPRNYLMTERSDRASTGTTVSVRLRDPLQQGSLTAELRRLCFNVEFPVEVDDLGERTTLTSEKPDAYVVSFPEIGRIDASFGIKAFPINLDGVEGAAYIFASTVQGHEDWTRQAWARDTYVQSHPDARIPELPHDLRAVHGITVVEDQLSNRLPGQTAYSIRADLRRAAVSLTASRSEINSESERVIEAELDKFITGVLLGHLQGRPRTPDEWRYRMRLLHGFDRPAVMRGIPGTLPCYLHAKDAYISLQDLRDMATFTVVFGLSKVYRKLLEDENFARRQLETDFCTIRDSDIALGPYGYRTEAFGGKIPTNVRRLGDAVALDWTAGKCDTVVDADEFGVRSVFILDIPDDKASAVPLHRIDIGPGVAVNRTSDFGKWYMRARDASLAGELITRDQFSKVRKGVYSAISFGYDGKVEFSHFMNAWLRSDLQNDVPAPQFRYSAGDFDWS